MMIIGCDFHPRYQQIAMMDTETGEMVERRLEHENGEARAFYASLPKTVQVGMEATGYAQWFERMLDEFGHELWIGHASEILAGAPPLAVFRGVGVLGFWMAAFRVDTMHDERGLTSSP